MRCLTARVDITVHSFKDMPMETNDDLPIAAVSAREDPRDVLILPKGEQNQSSPFGCSSARRKLQLLMLWEGIAVAPVRGNVLTRLEKTGCRRFFRLGSGCRRDEASGAGGADQPLFFHGRNHSLCLPGHSRRAGPQGGKHRFPFGFSFGGFLFRVSSRARFCRCVKRRVFFAGRGFCRGRWQ